MKILTNYNFLGNELQNAVIHPVASLEGFNPLKAGQVCFCNADKTLYVSYATESGFAWKKAGVVYEAESVNAEVITGLDSEGNVTKLAVADLVINENGCTLAEVHEFIHDIGEYLERDGVSIITVPDSNNDLTTHPDTYTDANLLAFNIYNPKNMDIAIIKREIGKYTAPVGDATTGTWEGSGKYQHTAYIYDANASAWKAMDGNYNADNVYFDEDIMITTAVGNIEVANGNGYIPAQGKNLSQVFQSIWTKEADPEVTQPSISISTSQQAKEVGTTVTPSYTVVFDDGNYQYGPDPTGSTFTLTSVTSPVSGEAAKTTMTGSFADFVVTEGECYNVTAKGSWTAGNTPVNNIGNPAPGKKIAAANDQTASKKLFKGYKPNFYGFTGGATGKDLIDVDNLTSAAIRGLATNQGSTTTPVGSATASTTWNQFFYAVPKGRKSSLSATDSNGLPVSFESKEVTITHAGGVTSTYTVFYSVQGKAYSATKLTFTWK